MLLYFFDDRSSIVNLFFGKWKIKPAFSPAEAVFRQKKPALPSGKAGFD